MKLKLPHWVVITPRKLELGALVVLLVILFGTVFAKEWIPPVEYAKTDVLRIIEVAFSGSGVVFLLLVWAELRHDATLNKLLAYHEYFHDLPGVKKISDLYEVLERLQIPVPLWQVPLADPHVGQILGDAKGSVAAREYLNDFEEFCAAVNSGLVDEEYAYALEGTRTLNAYFGFKALIGRWLANDKAKAEAAHETAPILHNYYGELRSVSERWRERKRKEAEVAKRQDSRNRIAERL